MNTSSTQTDKKLLTEKQKWATLFIVLIPLPVLAFFARNWDIPDATLYWGFAAYFCVALLVCWFLARAYFLRVAIFNGAIPLLTAAAIWTIHYAQRHDADTIPLLFCFFGMFLGSALTLLIFKK